MKMLVHQLPFTQAAYLLLYSYLFIANVTSPGQVGVVAGPVIYNISVIYNIIRNSELT